MDSVPCAKQSPRIENGVIKWYHGDTFELSFTLDLCDEDGRPVILDNTDTARIEFKNHRSGFEVFARDLFAPTQNTLSLDVDEEVTALFEPGEYDYDIHVSLVNKRVTIVKGNLVRVE